MTTKTPSGLAGRAGSDDETIDDSLDEILLHAHETANDRANDWSTDGPLGSGLPRFPLGRPNTATLMGVQASSLPIPGVAPRPEVTPAVMPRSEDVTQIARSSLLDEPKEEETKVEPPEEDTLRAAAKSEDEIALALTEQASAEREKALRKSIPSGPRVATPVSDSQVESEFESGFDDPSQDTNPRASALEDTNPRASALVQDTPASIAVGDDDDDSTANGRGPLSGSGAPAPTVSLSSPRLPPLGAPLGRSEPFGARLPVPTMMGFAVPSPSPAFGVPPSSPPFGVPVTAAYGSGGYTPGASSAFGGVRASSPAVPIPAPLGAPASVRRSPVYLNKVQLPVGAAMAFGLAIFSLGLLVGAALWRGAVAEVPVMVAVPAPVPPPIVAPAVPGAPAVPTVVQPPAAEPEVVAVPPSAAPPAPEPTLVAPAPEPPPARVASRPARRAAPAPVADDGTGQAPSSVVSASASLTTTPAKASRPKKTSGPKGPVDSRGVAKGWVDPFAQ